MEKQIFKFAGQVIDFNHQTWLMAILNITPDSFSDGGENIQVKKAVENALLMIKQGADIIDIGGESTRPGAKEISAEEEIERVIPVIKELHCQSTIPISIDTWKAKVAESALQAGASIINDISGLQRDPNMIKVLKKSNAGAILMHMRGTPQTMQEDLHYDNLIMEINQFFHDTLELTTREGIDPQRIIFDPGIGFAKSAEQNLTIIKKLAMLTKSGRPLLVGPSRKSFIGKILKQENPQKRLWGTTAAVTACVINGAKIIRVHDIPEIYDVIKVANKLK